MEEETLDEMFGGNLRVFQKKKGYRFSLDAILLAHFVSVKQRSCVIELGCGSGVILFILARRYPHIKCTGLEIQDDLAVLARKSTQLNDMDSRIQIVSGDARKIKDIVPAHSFDTVIFNPPYRKLNSGKINPQTEKAIARHEIKGSLKEFLKASQYLLKQGGRVFTIYPAKRLVELICFFRESNIEPKKMKLVFSDKNSEAEFALVEGRKGSREELKIESPMFIYDQNKKYTEEMADIFTGLSRFPSDGGE